MSRLQVIYRAHALHQAYMLKNLLESYGVASHVIDTDVASLRENVERTPEVVVAEKDVEVAKGIAEIFHQHLTANSDDASHELAFGNDDPGDGSAPWSIWPGWPKCPRCSERRQTACPICDNAGNLFSLADLPLGVETEDLADVLTSAGFVKATTERTESDALDTNVLLLCDICDEPFLPRFYCQCEHCGHEFDSGVPLPTREVGNWLAPTLVFGITCMVLYGLAVLYLLAN